MTLQAKEGERQVKRRILLALFAVLLMVQPAVMAARATTGLDGVEDIKPPQVYTGDSTVDSIINFALSIIVAVAEVFYDAFIKAPLMALSAAWGVVYNALLSWNIAAPMAWSISTLLFIAVGVVIIWLLATAMDWIM